LELGQAKPPDYRIGFSQTCAASSPALPDRPILPTGLRSRHGRIVGEFRQAPDGGRAQLRRIPRDCGFARLFDTWHTSVEGRDQFLELSRKLTHAHRHLCIRLAAASRRDAFQISPHPPHRQ
jgi:hypothetical protein